jgi:hypothetical protein
VVGGFIDGQRGFSFGAGPMVVKFVAEEGLGELAFADEAIVDVAKGHILSDA